MSYTLTADQFVARTYLLATGKAGTSTPTFGTPKYTKILAIGNMFQQSWAFEPDVLWASLRKAGGFSLGTISATATFTIPSTVGKVSDTEGDFVRIAHTDGISESEYTMVSPDRLYYDGPIINNYGRPSRIADGVCSVIGNNLVFSRAFLTTDPQFGGALTLPGYTIPADLVNSTDIVAVDDPNWLCFMSAAEYDRTDLTRVAQYQNLIAQATEAMAGMKDRNDSQLEDSNRGSFTPLGQTWI